MVTPCQTSYGVQANPQAVADGKAEACVTPTVDVIAKGMSTPDGGRKFDFFLAGRQEYRAVLDESGDRIAVDYDEETGEPVPVEGGEDYVPIYEYENDEVVGTYWAERVTVPFRYQSNTGQNGGRFIHPQFGTQLGFGFAVSHLVKKDVGRLAQEPTQNSGAQIATSVVESTTQAADAYAAASVVATDTAAATATTAAATAVADAERITDSITMTVSSYEAAAAAYTAAAAAYTAAVAAYAAAATTTSATEYTDAATAATAAAAAYTAAAATYSGHAAVLARPLTEYQGKVTLGGWYDVTDYSAAIQVFDPSGNGGMVDQVDTTVPDADKIYRMRGHELGLYLQTAGQFVSRTQPFEYVDRNGVPRRRGYVGVTQVGWYLRGEAGLFTDGAAGGNKGFYGVGVPGSTSADPAEDVSLRSIQSNGHIVHAVVGAAAGVILPEGGRLGFGVRSDFLPFSYKRGNPIETIEGDSLLVSGEAGNRTAENNPAKFHLSRSAVVYVEYGVNFWEPGLQIRQAALRASAVNP